jgi:tetraacyldisaccharide 4'-kinase
VKVPRVGVKVLSALWSCASMIKRKGSTPKRPVWLGHARVISVGNIQVGGAGKTPLVAKIVRDAVQRGLSVCILTRGYRGLHERSGGIIRPCSQDVTARSWGDEPALLHDMCPQAWMGVGANRLETLKKVFDAAGSLDLVVLDDGFQNTQLKKDVEIVALTSKKRGDVFFRDFQQSLKSADLCVWTKGAERPNVPESVPFVHVAYRLRSSVSHQAVWLVTGTADGESVYELATESGYTILRKILLQDHYSYDHLQVRELIEQAKKEGCQIALTGKDWVKWRDLDVQMGEVIVLEPEIEVIQGEEIFIRVLWNA